MARIFFDISDIVTYIRRHRSISGIQRAAVQIIAQAVRLQNSDEMHLSFYHPVKKTYVTCPATHLVDALENFNIDDLTSALWVQGPKEKIPAQFLVRYRTRPIKQAIHIARMRFAAWRGSPRYFEKRGLDFHLWQQLYAPGKTQQATTLASFADVAQPGDTLCGLGAIWGSEKVEHAFRAAHEHGVHVALFVHDLIPIKLPNQADPGAAKAFKRWLANSTEYVTIYLANSQATAIDLRAFLTDQSCDHEIHVTPLAQAGVGTDLTQQATLSPQIQEVTMLPFVLCVGTIEPRKNLWRLVQVWARLARRPDLDLPRLVLAGKRGWLMEGFLTLLDRTAGLGGWVIWVDAPTDAELDHLYRNCLFTATVSLYEGWGLPIGEGLSYGKTALVAEVSAMPEVGGDLVVYCDPTSMNSITNAALYLLTPVNRRTLEAKIAQTHLRSWADVGCDVLFVLTNKAKQT